MHTFNLIDPSRTDAIGHQELTRVNQEYSNFFSHHCNVDMNLKNDDIKLMIDNLKQKNLESVTASELFEALYKKN
jgi:hypothetical protein